MTASRTGIPKFEEVTETTGTPVSAEGASMMYTRYHVAAELARGKRVLEVACGSGQGLGLVGRAAAQVVAGDVSRALLGRAHVHYGVRIPCVRFRAEALPFAGGAFDLVLLFEASYYMTDLGGVLGEIARVLAHGGTALLVNANPERPDFIKSPHSVDYHSADDFRRALGGRGFRVSVEGAFPVDASAGAGRSRWLGRGLSLTRRVLEGLHLVPRTLQGRARLKRLVYGKLRALPPELPEDFAPVAPRTPLPPGPVRSYKVIYVTAHKFVGGEVTTR